jgi:hypothetical protein
MGHRYIDFLSVAGLNYSEMFLRQVHQEEAKSVDQVYLSS